MQTLLGEQPIRRLVRLASHDSRLVATELTSRVCRLCHAPAAGVNRSVLVQHKKERSRNLTSGSCGTGWRGGDRIKKNIGQFAME